MSFTGYLLHTTSTFKLHNGLTRRINKPPPRSIGSFYHSQNPTEHSPVLSIMHTHKGFSSIFGILFVQIACLTNMGSIWIYVMNGKTYKGFSIDTFSLTFTANG